MTHSQSQDLTTTITIAQRPHTVVYHPGGKGFIVTSVIDDAGKNVTASQKATVEGFYSRALQAHYEHIRPEAAASWQGAA